MKTEFDPLLIVVSREEVERGNMSGPLSTLKHMLSSQQTLRDFRERVDLSFDGYDGIGVELFDIAAVRTYLQALDLEFPYWLYFMSRQFPGLQCITLCFLPPDLTDEGKAKHHPPRLKELLEGRWVPALYEICEAAGFPDSEAEALLTSALIYLREGPPSPSK